MMAPDLLRLVASHWASGVAVVTSTAEGHPVGMTMSSVTSLSLDPPQFLACFDHRAKTLAAIRESGSFCINYLSEDQQHIAVEFSSRSLDRFVKVTYKMHETGAPVLDGVIAWVECQLHAIHDGGDHAIVVGNAVGGATPGGIPLVYFKGGYRRIAL